MFRACTCSAAVVLVSLAVLADPAPGEEKRTGKVTGELKSMKDTPNRKNVVIEVRADGEEKARSYRVQYDPAVKAPIPDVLKAVKAASVGDRVELEWVDTGEGLAIKKFAVLKKAAKEKE